jgi:hypothetical protein
MSIAFFGSVYRNEGSTNIGIPNWSDSTSGLSNAAFFLGFVTEVDTNGDGIIDNAIWDGNGDGFLDFNFQDPYNSLKRSDYVNSRDWVSPFKCLSLYTNGDYLLQDDNDTRIFYGALYAQRDTDVFSRGGQLFELADVGEGNWTYEVSATWYNIRITDSVADSSGGFIVANCYDNIDRPDGSSAFCGSINRDATTNRLQSICASFINIGLEGSQSTDFNIYYEQDFVVGENELSVSLDVQATKLKSAEQDILGDFDDNFGEPTFPEWRGGARLAIAYSDFRFNWSTRYIGKGEVDEPDDFDTYAPCDGLDV